MCKKRERERMRSALPLDLRPPMSLPWLGRGREGEKRD